MPGSSPAARNDSSRRSANSPGDGVDVEVAEQGVALETDFSGEIVDAMIAAVQYEDPGAAVLPYLLSAGTDNKHFNELGIRGYGFVPLRLPGDLDFAGMFHGVDERVPVESLCSAPGCFTGSCGRPDCRVAAARSEASVASPPR